MKSTTKKNGWALKFDAAYRHPFIMKDSSFWLFLPKYLDHVSLLPILFSIGQSFFSLSCYFPVLWTGFSHPPIFNGVIFNFTPVKACTIWFQENFNDKLADMEKLLPNSLQLLQDDGSSSSLGDLCHGKVKREEASLSYLSSLIFPLLEQDH